MTSIDSDGDCISDYLDDDDEDDNDDWWRHCDDEIGNGESYSSANGPNLKSLQICAIFAIICFVIIMSSR